MRHQKQANGQDGTNHTSTPSPQRRNLLLTPWKSYRPAMCKAMVQENRLGAMLDAAAVQCDELMCQLVLVQQMDYGAAWETALGQFLLPQAGSDSTSQNQPDPPGTSA